MTEEIKQSIIEWVNTKAEERFPIQWVEFPKNFKQEVNCGRRALSRELLEVGVFHGYALGLEASKGLLEALERLVTDGYANQLDKKAISEFKEKVGL